LDGLAGERLSGCMKESCAVVCTRTSTMVVECALYYTGRFRPGRRGLCGRRVGQDRNGLARLLASPRPLDAAGVLAIVGLLLLFLSRARDLRGALPANSTLAVIPFDKSDLRCTMGRSSTCVRGGSWCESTGQSLFEFHRYFRSTGMKGRPRYNFGIPGLAGGR
jgi:hypothetical protein